MGLIGLNHLASYVLFGYLLYHLFFLHLFRVSSLDCNSRFASLCNSCSLLFSPSGASLCFVCVSNFRLISSRKPQPWKTAHCDMSEELHGALDGQYHRLYKKKCFSWFFVTRWNNIKHFCDTGYCIDRSPQAIVYLWSSLKALFVTQIATNWPVSMPGKELDRKILACLCIPL